jgi:hypothetical protein
MPLDKILSQVDANIRMAYHYINMAVEEKNFEFRRQSKIIQISFQTNNNII